MLFRLLKISFCKTSNKFRTIQFIFKYNLLEKLVLNVRIINIIIPVYYSINTFCVNCFSCINYTCIVPMVNLILSISVYYLNSKHFYNSILKYVFVNKCERLNSSKKLYEFLSTTKA